MSDLTDYERGNRDGQALNEYSRLQAERGERILREQREALEAENTTLQERVEELARELELTAKVLHDVCYGPFHPGTFATCTNLRCVSVRAALPDQQEGTK